MKSKFKITSPHSRTLFLSPTHLKEKTEEEEVLKDRRNIKITLISIVVNQIGDSLPKESQAWVVAAKEEFGFL
jgi:hypothetical protein